MTDKMVPQADLDALRSKYDKQVAELTKTVESLKNRETELTTELSSLDIDPVTKKAVSADAKKLLEREKAIAKKELDLAVAEHASKHKLELTAVQEKLKGLPEDQLTVKAVESLTSVMATEARAAALEAEVAALKAGGVQRTPVGGGTPNKDVSGMSPVQKINLGLQTKES